MSEQLYKTIIDALPQALFILDVELRVILANKSCEPLVVRPISEIEGRALSEIIPHKDLWNHAQAVLQDGGTRVVELYPENKQAVPNVLRAAVTALDREGLGRPLCLIILEDIGEGVRLQEELVRSEKLAGMGLLASSIAHEIGNPLAIMTSTLQYVRETLVNAGDRPLTEAIETTVESIHQIQELLLSLSGFTGLQRPRFESTDLCRVLSRMLAFVRKEAERHDIEIHQQFDQDLPECQVDTGEIKQLFLNLFKNAIEAMPNGGKLCVTADRVPDAEGEIRIEVADTGVGMNEAEIRSIFRPFYSTKPGGTGLGLSFCRRVVEEHGGEIIVHSQLGGGSTFVITLPVNQGEGM